MDLMHDRQTSGKKYSIFKVSLFNSPAFTLAEVLITLGIIGVVATMVVPALINTTNDLEFKTEYKKAYSDLSQALTRAISEGSLTPRIAQNDAIATDSEWIAFKNAFKITTECTPAQLYSCWINGDVVNTSCPSTGSSSSFIDASGRSWAEYFNQENIYLVDTNGFKSPNKFGKDRWIFTFTNASNVRISSGLPTKVSPYSDDITGSGTLWCNYPPCYYKTWLYN